MFAGVKLTSMVVEYTRYSIPAERQDQFVRDYAEAAGSLEASPHCLGCELARCVEEPSQYVLRIEWDSAEAPQGLPAEPEFGGSWRSFVSTSQRFWKCAIMRLQESGDPGSGADCPLHERKLRTWQTSDVRSSKQGIRSSK